MVSVLVPSPRRVQPACEYFGTCGGCQLQHASYEFQLELKRGHVRETLARIARIADARVLPVLPSPSPFAYRNRIAVHSDGKAIGFFAAASRRVLDIARCPIASNDINRQLAELRTRRTVWKGTRVLREAAPFRGFRQVNDAAAEILEREVVRRLEPGGDHLLEGFCGGGFFTAPAAQLFRRVTAIEWSASAARAAKKACPTNVEIVEDDARLAIPRCLRNAPPDAVLLDPPATGLDTRIVTALCEAPPRLVVYVSCDPATLARLQASGVAWITKPVAAPVLRDAR